MQRQGMDLLETFCTLQSFNRSDVWLRLLPSTFQSWNKRTWWLHSWIRMLRNISAFRSPRSWGSRKVGKTSSLLVQAKSQEIRRKRARRCRQVQRKMALLGFYNSFSSRISGSHKRRCTTHSRQKDSLASSRKLEKTVLDPKFFVWKKWSCVNIDFEKVRRLFSHKALFLP